MGALRDVVVAYLTEREIPHYVDERGVTAFAGGSEHGTWTVYVTVVEVHEQVIVHSVLDDPVPADRIDEVCRFLTRANYGLTIGNFELDLDDGEVRYKTSLDVEGDALTDALFENLVIANVALTHRYLPGIEAVVAGEGHASALEAIEGGDASGPLAD